MANRTHKSVSLVEDATAPVRGPRWSGLSGSVRLLLSHNADTGIYTACARIEGKPFGATGENADPDVALEQAATNLWNGLQSPASGSRASRVTGPERSAVATLRARSR